MTIILLILAALVLFVALIAVSDVLLGICMERWWRMLSEMKRRRQQA